MFVLHSHCVTARLCSATSFYYCLNIYFVCLGLAIWISAVATEDVTARFRLLVGTTAGWEVRYRGKRSAKLWEDPLWWSKHQSQMSGCSVRRRAAVLYNELALHSKIQPLLCVHKSCFLFSRCLGTEAWWRDLADAQGKPWFSSLFSSCSDLHQLLA